jgi:hypothetical protein
MSKNFVNHKNSWNVCQSKQKKLSKLIVRDGID